MEILLKTINLKKYFKVHKGLLHAVDGVDIEIQKGKTLGVVGESGCGKSTLGRVILRLLEATSGEIYFEGRNIMKENPRGLKKDMQIIFQDPYSSLDPRLSVFELISEPLVVNRVFDHKGEMENRIIELMETVGLAERFINAYPHEMDGGRRQRVGIARALALNPKFIVCDEPVSALDVSIQAQVLNLLMDLQDQMGFTYMFITHNLSVVKHISDEIVVMYLGQCVEHASSRELFKNPLHPYTQALLAAIPKAKLGIKHDQKIIYGEVTNPVNPKQGCRFAARCEYCQQDCLAGSISLKEVEPDHFVSCVLYK
ncbi:MAG: ATP-binding cassette domain-containing protein [Firmicutes bacterium]|nr:ATP-binding cassette domain-containing protein [Bacillota bacterium]